MPWATEVGCKKTLQTDREQTENRETNYRGPSNRRTDRMAGEWANNDYKNNFMCIITN